MGKVYHFIRNSRLKRIAKHIISLPLWRKTKRCLEKAGHYIKYGTTDFFSEVSIETITACNRRCSYCPNSIFDRGLIKNKRILETKIYHKIIDELSEIDYNGIICPSFYGEPLLDERLLQLIEYTRKKLPNAHIIIYTNGDFLTLPLYKKLVNAGVNEWIITQHSEEKNKNILGILECQKVDPLAYTYYSKLKGISTRGGLIKAGKTILPEMCGLRNISQIVIDYGGNVVLCCQDYHSTVKFGNVKNEKLIDIWKKPAYKRIRRDINNGIFKVPICKRCIGKS